MRVRNVFKRDIKLPASLPQKTKTLKLQSHKKNIEEKYQQNLLLEMEQIEAFSGRKKCTNR